MGVVSFLNDLSSDMIFPLIPIFLTSVLGASLTFVGVIEGVADATSSILKIASGWLSDRWGRRKFLVVAGYSFSALSKPLLALATMPAHALGVRFLDRVGKGVREAPRDALISFSTPRPLLARAFGFHRALDTLGASLGPLVAFAVLPLIHQNYRTLFLLSFIASFLAVLILIFFVREVRTDGSAASKIRERPMLTDIRPNPPAIPQEPGRPWARLGLPFFLFLAVASIASLGKASEAFLILRAREVGIAVALVPILYFVYSLTLAILATPLGVVADRVGKRNTFAAGLLVFSVAYFGFAFADSARMVWFLFIIYGLYAALTEGVGRAIVAALVPSEIRSTAFGIYNASVGLALLPASVVFGYFNQHFGSRIAFSYGAALALAAALGFLFLRKFLEAER